MNDGFRSKASRSTFRFWPGAQGAGWWFDATRGLALGMLLAVLCLLTLDRHPLGARLEYHTMDTWFGLRDPLPPGPVSILAIDEATLQRWGNYATFNDADISRLLRLLKQAGARAAVLAAYQLTTPEFRSPQPDELAGALRESGIAHLPLDFVYGAVPESTVPHGTRAVEPMLRRFAIQSAENSEFLESVLPAQSALVVRTPATSLLRAAQGAGHINFILDADGYARKMPLALAYGGAIYPALSLSAASALGVKYSTLVEQTAAGGSLLLNYPSGIPLGEPAPSQNASNDGALPTDRITAVALDGFPVFSVAEVLDNPAILRSLRDATVIIGPTAAGTTNIFTTPSGRRVPSVTLHAVALDNLLMGRALRPAPSLWITAMTIAVCALVGVVAATRSPLVSVAVTLLFLVAPATLSFYAFTQHIWFNPTAAWLGTSGTFLIGVVSRARNQERSGMRVASTIEALTQVSRVIALQTKPHEILQNVLNWAQDAIQATGAAVLLLDETDGSLHYAAATGPRHEELLMLSSPRNSIAEWVITHGEAAVINDPAHDPRFSPELDEAIGFHTRSLLCVPLRTGDRTLGVLQIVNREGKRPFTLSDAELLMAVANQAAAALDNSQLYQHLNERVAQAQADLMRTNRRLESEKELMRTVLQSMSDGVLVTDGDGRIQIVNFAAHLLLPELGEKAVGKPLGEIVPEMQASQNQQSEMSTLHLKRYDGESTRIIEVRTAPLQVFEGEASGQVAVFADVTQAQEIQQAKSDFVAFVAHEMRSPLTSIAGFTAMLLRDEEDEPHSPETRYLGIIRDESDRLTRLINSLLDVARIEAGGGLQLHLEPLNFALLARQAAELQRGYSDSHEIVCDLPPDLPPVQADPDKTKQVLINLLSNAQKHTPNGVITITATAPPEENHLEVCVRDQGPGIPPEVQERLFERFSTSTAPDSSTTSNVSPASTIGRSTRAPSTGLGLFLTKHIVEAHGGRVWVESVQGQGAAFYFTLPRS